MENEKMEDEQISFWDKYKYWITGATVIPLAIWGYSSLNNNQVNTSYPPDDDIIVEESCQYSCDEDRDCSDFRNHRQAQDFFSCCGFTADNDPMKLDSLGEGNGIACESLP